MDEFKPKLKKAYIKNAAGEYVRLRLSKKEKEKGVLYVTPYRAKRHYGM